MVDKTVEELRKEMIALLRESAFNMGYKWVHNECIEFVDELIAAVRAEEGEKNPLPLIYGIFTAGENGTLLSKIQDRADSGHCDLHYGGLIERGKRYGLILLPERGGYICAPLFKEEKK